MRGFFRGILRFFFHNKNVEEDRLEMFLADLKRETDKIMDKYCL
jgi:hypothetical protein